jgi:hypothetical protein
MSTNYNWTCVLQVPNGHRYFQDSITGQYAGADESGPTPDRTDDGVLWLDLARPISLDLRNATVYGWVPVRKESEKGEFWLCEYLVDAMLVAETFGLTVEPAGDMVAFVAAYEKHKSRTELEAK